MSASPLSRLPVEILSSVLEATLDPIFQWCVCRDVSHQFRNAVHLLFERTVLPETCIEFDLDWDYLDQEEMSDKCMFDVRCKFIGFADDAKETALFKEEMPEPKNGEDAKRLDTMQQMLKQKWVENVSSIIWCGELLLMHQIR